MKRSLGSEDFMISFRKVISFQPFHGRMSYRYVQNLCEGELKTRISLLALILRCKRGD